ncbi:hypothetical protein HanRHA438_Chr17g0808261 [Helianthus annuus]|nr:hypothetical protein HanRHA438_Chr17g0808261 [Helianthus annuus]
MSRTQPTSKRYSKWKPTRYLHLSPAHEHLLEKNDFRCNEGFSN